MDGIPGFLLESFDKSSDLAVRQIIGKSEVGIISIGNFHVVVVVVVSD